MPIRLLALDIDGTLLTSRGELTPRNQKAIEAARNQGVHIVLMTGRRFGSAWLLLQELAFDVPVVSHNGALTKDTKTLETIDIHPLENDTAHEIIRTARHCGADMILCCDEPGGLGKMVVEGISETNGALNRYLKKYADTLHEVGDLLDYNEHPPLQMMFSGSCARMEEFAVDLQRALGDRVRIFKTRYPSVDLTILDAISPRASKGDSLAMLAGQLGIRREDVMAVGDNHNDLPMLHYAGRGVVMGNAESEMKQFGFAETSSNEESGVAEAIEKYILTRSQNEQ
jgi:hypothetical protein